MGKTCASTQNKSLPGAAAAAFGSALLFLFLSYILVVICCFILVLVLVIVLLLVVVVVVVVLVAVVAVAVVLVIVLVIVVVLVFIIIIIIVVVVVAVVVVVVAAAVAGCNASCFESRSPPCAIHKGAALRGSQPSTESTVMDPCTTNQSSSGSTRMLPKFKSLWHKRSSSAGAPSWHHGKRKTSKVTPR